MRIGIAVFGSAPGKSKGRGISVYLKNLIRNLSYIDKENEYFIFTGKKDGEGVLNGQKENFHFVIFPLPENVLTRVLFDQFILAMYAVLYKIDVMHYPLGRASLFHPKKSVITIHDLMYKYYAKEFPGYIASYKIAYFDMILKSTLKNIDGIIAISDYTAQELQRYFNFNFGKLNTIHPGINYDYFRRSVVGKYKDLYKNLGQYILTVKSTSPHKNLKSVLMSFALARKKYHIPHKLVVVGSAGLAHKEFIDLIKANHIERQTVFLRNVSDEELFGLYEGADLFLFLSLNEGFGFPVLEAMASGVPVICSNKASLPEIVGEAAILIDPLNTNRITETINYCLYNEELRKKLIKRGLQRATRFSWKETALRTLQVYKKVKIQI